MGGVWLLEEFKRSLAYHFSEVLERPLAKPYWVYVSLSHKCTYNCQMCGVVKILKEYELPAERVQSALDEIAGWGWDCVVMLTGGEPFLRKDIFQIINHSVRRGLKTEAVSNGSLVDEDLAKRIVSSGLQNIAVSLDGATEKTHDSIREKGSFKKALLALERLVEAKRSKGYGPQISVWTTIMKENVEELFDVASVVEALGVECLVYHPVIVAQDDMQNTSPNAPFWIRGDNLKILKEQIDRIVDYKGRHGLIEFLHDPYLWIRYFDGTLAKKDWKCNPFVFINIGPNGEVRSCGAEFGNIRSMGLLECLNSEEAHRARRSMKNCQKPCLQTCWAHPESDFLTEVVDRLVFSLRENHWGKEAKRRVLQEALDTLTGYESVLNGKSE